jgi:Zn-dependent peptidase ImmA (M78 family)
LLRLVERFSYLKMVVQHWPLPVSGILIHRRGKWHCIINSEEPLTRQRFTFCHEVAHRILHSSEEKFFCDAPWTAQNERERQANHFAAQILMPEETVVPFWAAVRDGVPPDLWVTTMAAQFGVSPQAMGIRLQQLDLVLFLPERENKEGWVNL